MLLAQLVPQGQTLARQARRNLRRLKIGRGPFLQARPVVRGQFNGLGQRQAA
jgi:hypothetical protein